MYGAFVWARRALNSQKRRFPARAVRRRRAAAAAAPAALAAGPEKEKEKEEAGPEDLKRRSKELTGREQG